MAPDQPLAFHAVNDLNSSNELESEKFEPVVTYDPLPRSRTLSSRVASYVLTTH